jgi:ATP-binding cassette subfamily A (ABC1) protein 3
MTFFVYFTFLPAAATYDIIIFQNISRSPMFYIIISLISPQCNIAFNYVVSLNPYEDDDKHSKFNPFAKPTAGNMNFFPTSIYEAYSFNSSLIQIICSYIIYLLLFLYFDQVIPNEYGIAKHPLFIF